MCQFDALECWCVFPRFRINSFPEEWNGERFFAMWAWYRLLSRLRLLVTQEEVSKGEASCHVAFLLVLPHVCFICKLCVFLFKYIVLNA